MQPTRHLYSIVLTIGFLAAAQPGWAQSTERRSPTLLPGESFKECRNCPDMIVLPSGQFTMGSPADDPDREEDEPQQEGKLHQSRFSQRHVPQQPVHATVRQARRTVSGDPA